MNVLDLCNPSLIQHHTTEQHPMEGIGFMADTTCKMAICSGTADGENTLQTKKIAKENVVKSSSSSSKPSTPTRLRVSFNSYILIKVTSDKGQKSFRVKRDLLTKSFMEVSIGIYTSFVANHPPSSSSQSFRRPRTVS